MAAITSYDHRAGSGTHQAHAALIKKHRQSVISLVDRVLGLWGVGKISNGDTAKQLLDQRLDTLRREVVAAEMQTQARPR